MKNEYQDISIHTEVNDASPFRLVQMLLSACVDRIRESIRHDEDKEISKKCEKINKAVNIIRYLKSILRAEDDVSNQFVDNLVRVYDYTEQHLFNATIKNDRRCLEVALHTTQKIKNSWDEMGVKHGLR